MCSHPPVLPLIVSLPRSRQTSRPIFTCPSVRRREDTIIDQLHYTRFNARQRSLSTANASPSSTHRNASHRCHCCPQFQLIFLMRRFSYLSQRIVETERSLRTRDFRPRQHRRGGRGVPNDPDRPASRIPRTHSPPQTCPLLRAHSW